MSPTTQNRAELQKNDRATARSGGLSRKLAIGIAAVVLSSGLLIACPGPIQEDLDGSIGGTDAGSDVTEAGKPDAAGTGGSKAGSGGAGGHGGAVAKGGAGGSKAGSGGSGGSPLHVMEERVAEEGQCKEGQVWLFGACFP